MGIGRDHYKSPRRSASNDRLDVVYVRKNGKDTFDGLKPNRAVRTINQALRLINRSSAVGILVDIGPGIWAENIVVPKINFFGEGCFSRTLSSRVGLVGNKSDYLGLIFRGTPGACKEIGFQTPAGKDRFDPEPKIREELDGNANNLFYPATKIEGTISCLPSAAFELSCMEVTSKEHRSSLNFFGGLVTIRGVVVGGTRGLSVESFSDIKVSGCLVKAKTALDVRSSSILKARKCFFVGPNKAVRVVDSSFALIRESSIEGSLVLENKASVVMDDVLYDGSFVYVDDTPYAFSSVEGSYGSTLRVVGS